MRALDLIHAVLQGVAGREVLAHRDQQAVGPDRADQRVGHDVHRRQVDDDILKEAGQMLQKLMHPLRAQKLRGVGRHIARGDDVPVAVVGGDLHALALTGEAGQQVRQARRALHAQLAVHRRQTHVRVDQQHALAGLGDRVGEVHGRGRFALVADGARDADDLAGLILGQDKLQVRAQALVRLRRGEAQIVAQRALLFALAAALFHACFLIAHAFAPPSSDAFFRESPELPP